jgi:hypothetical protein
VNRRFPHAERYDVDRLVAFAHSRSHTILLNEPDRLALVEQVRALAPAGQFRLPLVCHVWRGEKAR